MKLILVESPFQLIQALEILDKGEKCVFFIRLNSIERNNQQLKQMVSTFKVTNVIYLYSGFKLNIFLYLIPLLIFSLFANKFYIGDENSVIFRFIKFFIRSKKIWLLDDGVATLNTKPGLPYNRYTIFDNIVGVHNSLDYCSRVVNKEIDKEDVYIIVGGKLAEENICTKEVYHSIIEDMIYDFGVSAQNIIYIPHRGESKENIKDLSIKFNLKVVENLLPVELVGLEFRYNPICVSSVLSTALYSMSLIYKEAEFKVYPLKSQEIMARREPIEKLYREMKANTCFFDHMRF